MDFFFFKDVMHLEIISCPVLNHITHVHAHTYCCRVNSISYPTFLKIVYPIAFHIYVCARYAGGQTASYLKLPACNLPSIWEVPSSIPLEDL